MEKSSEGGMMTKRAALPDLPGQSGTAQCELSNLAGLLLGEMCAECYSVRGLARTESGRMEWLRFCDYASFYLSNRLELLIPNLRCS